MAARLKRAVVHPEHPEILSSIGAAVSLVRAELTRNATSDGAAVELAREAEAACVASGAAPATVTVETAFDTRDNVLRAVATGAVALEVGAADREPAGEETRLRAAADALGLEPGALQLIAETGFYQVYSENGSGRVAAIDGLGAVALAEDARRVLAASGPELVEQLLHEVQAATRNLGVATLCRASRSSTAPASSTSPTRDVPRTSPPPRPARSRASAAPPSPSSRARCRSTGKHARGAAASGSPRARSWRWR